MDSTVNPTNDEPERMRRERYRKAAELLRQWKSEDPEYDERVGKRLEDELIDSATRC